jgi:hypothetical protein
MGSGQLDLSLGETLENMVTLTEIQIVTPLDGPVV